MGLGALEHHVTDCAFHNHDAGEKRKMLGGVSFDGGAGSAAKGGVHTRAGVQTAQPPFPDVQRDWDIPWDTQGAREGNGNARSGVKTDAAGRPSVDKHRKDVLNITNVQDRQEKAPAKEMEQSVLEQNAAAAMADKVALVNAIDSLPAKVKKYLSLLDRKMIGMLKNGIQAFLKGMEQKAGKESRQQPKKKGNTGTRAITKEEMYEMQINTAYLLDSYNKNGERSTLGKD